MASRIDHVNIVVEDLGRMTSFYQDLLGLRLVRRIRIHGDWITSLTGLEGVEAEVAYLEGAGEAGLELICYRRPKGARPQGLERPNTLGLRHLAFRVDGLDELAERVEEAGGQLVSPVREVPTEQVDFAGRRKRIVYLRDPEANLVELCTYEATTGAD